MNSLRAWWLSVKAMDRYLDDDRARGRFVHDEVISRITYPVKTVIEYGSGGKAWTAGFFPTDTHIVLSDEDGESLNAAAERLRRIGFKAIQTVRMEESPSRWLFAHVRGAADLLTCATTSCRFPGFSFFKEVVETWKWVEPRFIVLTTAWARETTGKDGAPITDGRGFLRLSSRDVRETLAPSYDEVYHFREMGMVKRRGEVGMEYWLFARRGVTA